MIISIVYAQMRTCIQTMNEAHYLQLRSCTVRGEFSTLVEACSLTPVIRFCIHVHLHVYLPTQSPHRGVWNLSRYACVQASKDPTDRYSTWMTLCVNQTLIEKWARTGRAATTSGIIKNSRDGGSNFHFFCTILSEPQLYLPCFLVSCTFIIKNLALRFPSEGLSFLLNDSIAVTSPQRYSLYQQ